MPTGKRDPYRGKTPKIEKDIYVFDMDGTLTNCQHRLHHIKCDKPDWDAFYLACNEDPPIQEMVDLAGDLYDQGNRIYIITGRSEICRDETLWWLWTHELPVDDDMLLMRARDDYRTDDVIKIELAEQAGIFNQIKMVFEDRDRVVKEWRLQGIRCLQVAEGDF